VQRDRRILRPVTLHVSKVLLVLVGVVTAYAAFTVFVLGWVDPKFGVWGTFRLWWIIGVAPVVVEAIIYFMMQAIWAVVLKRYFRVWVFRSSFSLVLFTIVAGGICIYTETLFDLMWGLALVIPFGSSMITLGGIRELLTKREL